MIRLFAVSCSIKTLTLFKKKPKKHRAHFWEFIPSNVRIILSFNSSSNLFFWDLVLQRENRSVFNYQTAASGGPLSFHMLSSVSALCRCQSYKGNSLPFWSLEVKLPHWHILQRSEEERETEKKKKVREVTSFSCHLISNITAYGQNKWHTAVLIFPFSLVMLSLWCRLAKGLAAPQDSR